MTTQNENQPRDLNIAVIIPSYNCGPYLCRAIDSILAQTYPPNEIIVVDDGSTDNTADTIKPYLGQVTYIQQENAGASTARNTGIEASTADWLAFLDADDEWLPEYLATQADLLNRCPEIKWSTGNTFNCLCMENRREACMSESKVARHIDPHRPIINYLDAYINQVRGSMNTTIIHRSVFDKVGLFRVAQKSANDLDMWFRISHWYPMVGYIIAPLAVYHMQVNESISQTPRSLVMLGDLLERHLELARQAGQGREFTKLASWQVQSWIRSAFFDNRSDTIRDMVKQFSHILPSRYRKAVYLATINPRLTTLSLRLISKIIRASGLSKRAVRPPYKK